MSDNKQHIDLGEQVLKTLLYFDIFSYPLKAEEVVKFLRVRCRHRSDAIGCLNELMEKKHVFRFGDLYGLHADEKNAKRRIRGNKEAEKWLTVARKKAHFIGKFPFVRGVMASGSLSKGYMDEKSDLDFFVVTAPGRLWIARTLLVVYKRVFLLNSHKQFCVNYFVDTDHLEIEEKNLFTATELATLIPLYGHDWYRKILRSNMWMSSLFPNFRYILKNEEKGAVPDFFKSFFEFLLLPFSTWLDKLFMRVSLKRWCRLYSEQYSKEDFEVAFKTRRHVSKNHPNHYQKKILELYQSKLAEFKHQLAQLTTYE